MIQYRGTTRAEMERVGLALPRRIYQCLDCQTTYPYKDAYDHWLKCLTSPKADTLTQPQLRQGDRKESR